jgi:methylsterol monooxygenase
MALNNNHSLASDVQFFFLFQIDRQKLKKAVKVVLFNGFCVSFFITLAGVYLMKWRGCAFSGEMPTFQWVLIELTICSLVEEVGFYYSHR